MLKLEKDLIRSEAKCRVKMASGGPSYGSGIS
jgi:hypothetical protein